MVSDSRIYIVQQHSRTKLVSFVVVKYKHTECMYRHCHLGLQICPEIGLQAMGAIDFRNLSHTLRHKLDRVHSCGRNAA